MTPADLADGLARRAAAGAPGRSRVDRGAALSRPDTPSTLLASDAGTEMGVALARSWYGPALAAADAGYSLSWVRKAASMREADPVART